MTRGDHLSLRNGVYQYRRRVPGGSVERVGKKEIVQSLVTRNLSDAKKLRNQLDARYDRIFDGANITQQLASVPAPPAVPLTDFWNALQGHFCEVKARARASFLTCPPDSNEDRLHREEDVGTTINILENRDDPRADELVSGIFRDVFGSNWVSIAANATLGEAVRRALLEIEREKLARIEDKADLTLIPPDAATDNDLTFGQLGADYLKFVEKSAAANATSQKWVDKQAAHVQTLNDIVGVNTPVKELNFSACENVQLTLSKLPAHRTKRFAKHSLNDAISAGAEKGANTIGPTTQKGYLATFEVMLERGHRRGAMTANPAKGIKPVSRNIVPPGERRLSLDQNQMRALLCGTYYQSCAKKGWRADPKGWRFWLPLLSAYMGMRPNEICQLGVDDLKQTPSGTHFLDFTDHAEDEGKPAKQLKTHSSRRRLPLHPAVIRVGFLEFVAHRREQGEQKLFPTLRPDQYGNYAKYPLKQFREVYMPLEMALRDRQSFYSIRHSFRDALRAVDAPEEVLEGVGGWKQGGNRVSDRYGDRMNPDFTFRWLSQVEYAGVDQTFLIAEQREKLLKESVNNSNSIST